MKYNQLRCDKKFGIPAFDALQPIILQILMNNQRYHLQDLVTAITNKIELPEPLSILKQKGGTTILYNRAERATSFLVCEHFINRVKQGVYRISLTGKSLLTARSKYEDIFVTTHYLNTEIIKGNRLCNHDDTKKHYITEPSVNTKEQSINSKTFAQHLKAIVNKYNSGLKEVLLSEIFRKDPYSFEHLVVVLLDKMGYKGKNGTAITTKKSNDNGIDGIINQDPLGTSTVYVQAKRYRESNIVGTPDIQGFYGALKSKQASKGVFITTSDFSKGAKHEAKKFGIVIINGNQLAKLMFEYRVGVQVQDTLNLLTVDKDFFNEI